jgi:hypothetical protein
MRLDMGAGEAVAVEEAEGAEAAGAVEEAAPALAVADLVAVVLAVVVVEAAVGAAAAGAGDTVAATPAATVGVVAAATDTSAVVVLMVTVTTVMAGSSPKAVASTSVTTAGATSAWCAATTDGNELATLGRMICAEPLGFWGRSTQDLLPARRARGALLGWQLGQRPSGTKPAITIRRTSECGGVIGRLPRCCRVRWQHRATRGGSPAAVCPESRARSRRGPSRLRNGRWPLCCAGRPRKKHRHSTIVQCARPRMAEPRE